MCMCGRARMRLERDSVWEVGDGGAGARRRASRCRRLPECGTQAPGHPRGVGGYMAGANMAVTAKDCGVFGSASGTFGTGVIGEGNGGSGITGRSIGRSPANGNGVFGYVQHVGQSQISAGVFGTSDVSYGV